MNNSTRISGLLVVLVASLYLAGAVTAVFAQPPTSEPAMEETEVGTGLCEFKCIARLTPLRPLGCNRDGCEMFLLNVDMHSYQNLGVMCAGDKVYFMTHDEENYVHLIIIRGTLSSGYYRFSAYFTTFDNGGQATIKLHTIFNGTSSYDYPPRTITTWGIVDVVGSLTGASYDYVDFIIVPGTSSVWFHWLEIYYLGPP